MACTNTHTQSMNSIINLITIFPINPAFLLCLRDMFTSRRTKSMATEKKFQLFPTSKENENGTLNMTINVA